MWAGKPLLGSPQSEATPLSVLLPGLERSTGTCLGAALFRECGLTSHRPPLTDTVGAGCCPMAKAGTARNIKGDQCCEEGIEMMPSLFPHWDQKRTPLSPCTPRCVLTNPCSHRREKGMCPTTRHSPQAGQPGGQPAEAPLAPRLQRTFPLQEKLAFT